MRHMVHGSQHSSTLAKALCMCQCVAQERSSIVAGVVAGNGADSRHERRRGELDEVGEGGAACIIIVAPCDASNPPRMSACCDAMMSYSSNILNIPTICPIGIKLRHLRYSTCLPSVDILSWLLDNY